MPFRIIVWPVSLLYCFTECVDNDDFYHCVAVFPQCLIYTIPHHTLSRLSHPAGSCEYFHKMGDRFNMSPKTKDVSWKWNFPHKFCYLHYVYSLQHNWHKTPGYNDVFWYAVYYEYCAGTYCSILFQMTNRGGGQSCYAKKPNSHMHIEILIRVLVRLMGDGVA